MFGKSKLLKVDYKTLKNNYVNKMIKYIGLTTDIGGHICVTKTTRGKWSSAWDFNESKESSSTTSLLNMLSSIDKLDTVWELLSLYRDEPSRMKYSIAIYFKKKSKYLYSIHETDEKDIDKMIEDRKIEEKLENSKKIDY